MPARHAPPRGVTRLLLLAALLAGRPALAQDLALKRAAVRPRPSACPVTAPPRQPAPDQRDEARQRATLGQEAAIVGNQRAAREQFQRAAQLDPTSEDIAYQYGRTLEDGGSPTEALREYCRYLALAPAGGDAADVRARVAALAPPAPASSSDKATPYFQTGLASYDSARYENAEQAFTRAIQEAPSWAEAHYNRAITYLARREPARAAADLRRYLELRPDAVDRVSVLNRLELIERPVPYTASGALVRGIIPGLGQFYTRRPIFGAAVLAAAGGGVALAMQSKQEPRRLRRIFVDINGQPREYFLDTVVTVHPNRNIGYAVIGGVTALAAVEAYLYARRTRANVVSGGLRRSASFRVVPLPARDPRATGVAFDVRLALPRSR